MPDETTTEREKITTTVVVSRQLASMIRVIADHDDATMLEILDRHARPAILREYRRVLDAKQRELGGEA